MEWSSIELTREEQRLYDSIEWDEAAWSQWDTDSLVAMFDRAGMLTEKLLNRQAAPRIRVEWFTNPKWNVERRWRSRQEALDSKGNAGPEVYRHCGFLSCLWYLIHGPRLPRPTINGFELVLQEHGNSEKAIDEICVFVRREVQRRRLTESADEFMKLAIECGQSDFALAVRTTAKAEEFRQRQKG